MHAAGRDLTVVIAAVNNERSIAQCVESIRRSCDGLAAEILLVDASEDRTLEVVSHVAPEVTIIRRQRGSLVPELWAEGLRQAVGEVVAFTTGHCRVELTWARALIDGIAAGAAGVGGRFRLDAKASATGTAMSLLRYSAFLETPGEKEQGFQEVREIAADNAAYSHEALSRHDASFARGFWEVEFHHRLRAEQRRLALVANATTTVCDTTPLARLLAQRFAHGRHFGAWRRSALGHFPIRVVLAGPLVPLLLFSRVVRRLLRRRALSAPLVASTMPFLLLASAWAAGEVVGACISRPVRERKDRRARGSTMSRHA